MERTMRKALWTFLLLTGCAARPVHPLRPIDVPTIPYVEGARAESIEGSLMWEDGCLLFRSERGDHLLPIWPRTSKFNGTSMIFRRPGRTEQPLLLNEEVVLGGERLPIAYVETNFHTYAQRCGGAPFFVADVQPAD
jgi:hypothetical protein